MADPRVPRAISGEPLELKLVNLYVLQKGHLLGRSRGGVREVVQDIVALHATSAATPYLSLWARIARFRAGMLDEVLYERRELIRLEAMRGTLFIVPVELAPIIYQATKPPEKELERRCEEWGIAPKEYGKLSRCLLKALESGPLTIRELKQALAGEVRPVKRQVGRATYRSTNVNVVLQALVRRGAVGSEKERGTTSTISANRYFLLEQLYPEIDLGAVPPEEARLELLRRYIQAFGPVSPDDCAWWMGWRKAEVRWALAELAAELLIIAIEDLGDGWLMLESDYEKFLEFEPPEEPVVALLPYEDPYPKGYKRRPRLITPQWERRAYPGGSVRPTIIVDGRIVGLWEIDGANGRRSPTLQLFEEVSPAVKAEIDRRAEALGRFTSSLGGDG